MPRKQDAYRPRVYTKTVGKERTHYVLYYEQGKRKFHKCHPGKCLCGKPRPNRPCEHLKAAQEVLLTFEAKLSGKAMDASLEYLIHEWANSDHSHRSASTVKMYLATYRDFLDWCNEHGYLRASQIIPDGGQREPLADYKRYLENKSFKVCKHTPESRRLLRQIDYLVRRDKVSRDSPDFAHKDLVQKMHSGMVIMEKPYSKANIHRIMRELHVLFSYAVYARLMASNPLDEAGKPRSLRLTVRPRTESRRNCLTANERTILLEGLKGDYLDMAIIMMYAGLRIGEIVNLHRSHLQGNCIHIAPVNGWVPKWKMERDIPMHKRVKEVIARQLAKHPGSEYVFQTKNGTKYGTGNLKHRFPELFDALGIKGIYGTGVTCHGLRHTFISTMIAHGENLVKVQSMAGHKDIRTTMLYAHDLDKRTSSVMDAID